MANLFDIGSGGSRIRYFVCKSSEEIIMNTLELITADEYLYRVLINEGYERIVFLDEDVSAFSYDESLYDSICEVLNAILTLLQIQQLQGILS